MIARLRRIIAAVLIPFVLVWSIMMPRQAYSFAPPGVAAIMISGTLASGVVVPLAVGAVIAGIAYWAFNDLTSLDEVRVPAVNGAAGIVPAPAASTTTALQTFYYASSVSCANVSFPAAANCEAALYTSNNAAGGTWSSLTVTGCTGNVSCTTNQAWIDSYWGPEKADTPGVWTSQSYQGCGAGYTLSGSVCNLNNARAAVADGKKDYSRSGASYATYLGDQVGSLSATTMTSNSANDTVMVVGKDSAGNALQGKIIAQADGGSKVELKVQKQSASGQSYVETQTYQTSPTGDVVTATQSAAASSLTWNPTTKTYTETAAPAGSLTPDLSQAASQPIQFPSDYARQGEAASAAQSISNILGPKLDKITETSPAPPDPTLPDPSGYTDFGSTFSSLLGWQLPGHTSQCPTGSFNTPWNTSYTIDSHCQLIANHWGALQSAMFVVWTVAALFIVLKA